MLVAAGEYIIAACYLFGVGHTDGIDSLHGLTFRNQLMSPKMLKFEDEPKLCPIHPTMGVLVSDGSVT